MDLMQPPTLLSYKNYRDLKISSLLLSVAIATYGVTSLLGGETSGGSWLGYLLGILSLMIIFLLLAFGLTKRRTPKYIDRRVQQNSGNSNSRNADAGGVAGNSRKVERRNRPAKDSWYYGRTLQGWLSLHIYLGASLIVLATLHSDFQFGWNIHTLSYALMWIVIASGFYGVYTYLNYPRRITQNMPEDTLDELLPKIADLDEQARIRALELPDDVNALVLQSRQKTRVGGNLFQQIYGMQRNCPTAYAVAQLHQLCTQPVRDDQAKLMHDLYTVLLHKEKLVIRARTEILLKARLECWLYLHVPLSIALMAALATHVIAVFVYR